MLSPHGKHFLKILAIQYINVFKTLFKDVFGAQPWLLIMELSSNFLGLPSGLSKSKVNSPSNPIIFLISNARS